MPEHEKGDKLWRCSGNGGNGCCLRFTVQSVRLQLDFFHFSMEGKHHLAFCLGKHHAEKLFSTLPISFLWARFLLSASMPAPSITEPLRVMYKQLFPPPQHVPSYLRSETQMCVVNGHAQYKLV